MTVGKIGLALGGGAARGWAHIGVIKALEDAGIRPDIIAGTSIGAVVGGCYAAERLNELEDFARSLTRRKILGYLDINFSGSGLINGQRLCNKLESHLEDTVIEDLQQRFVAVATEMQSGHEIWLSRGSLVEALGASYALPGIFRPVNIGGRWMFDGALVNPVPVSVCRALGARYVIAVNLNADMCGRGTVVPFEEVSAGAPHLHDAEPEAAVAKNGKDSVPMKTLLHRQIFGSSNAAPGITKVMVDAFNIVQDRIARSRLAGDPPDVVINPKLHGIGLFDFHCAEDLINRGVKATERELSDIAHELELRRMYQGEIAASAG